MYSTCLFCNSSLGRNEALEQFPVGRRLAYDEAKGRLWVVCAKCERWNLSPLDTRWEAIEVAERLFRATRLRVSTDNVGLAQLNEGLQLVRLGKPPKIELAGWRYGDQFGRRRRRHLIIGTATLVGGAALLTAGAAGMFLGMVGVGNAANITLNLAQWVKMRRDTKVIRATIRRDDGEALPLTAGEIRGLSLIANDRDGRWSLKVRHNEPKGARTWRQHNVDKRTPSWLPPSTILTGEAAQHALSAMLPQINTAGGNAKTVRDAVSALDSAVNVDAMLSAAARMRLTANIIPGENNVAGLPAPLRLALEMVLHENDERRALQGEMAALEARWREAEEIAGIADSLLEPPDIQKRLNDLRSRADRPPTG